MAYMTAVNPHNTAKAVHKSTINTKPLYKKVEKVDTAAQIEKHKANPLFCFIDLPPFLLKIEFYLNLFTSNIPSGQPELH